MDMTVQLSILAGMFKSNAGRSNRLSARNCVPGRVQSGRGYIEGLHKKSH